MAPRKQVKQAAAETTVALADADGNVTPPKKSKTVKKSTVAASMKQAKTAAPRQLRQVKERQAVTMFSPKYLRSRNKDVVPKNVAENEPKKVPINKQKKEEAVVEDNEIGEKVVKNKVQKKAPTVAKSAVKKAEENPPKKTRGGKTVDEENVAPPAKVRSVKQPRKRRNAQTEVAEPEEKKSIETIRASKEPREKAKKTAKTTAKNGSKKNSSKSEMIIPEIEAELGTEDGQNIIIEEAKIKEEDTYEKNFAKAKVIISKMETKLKIENGQTNTMEEALAENDEKDISMDE
ncbi:uncharacterized protein LOC126854976 isoform X2 [Cataglyphis hispanica]|uniref:uncharacterized protein LOC126854976 isoform X2 n=1 Tax=Cataglyphis hispanica TaxID=1086592 RepID=UPI00217FE2D6|nr:uncharacterized protein LOC126854976 isoform X2 [Cataglyphis hispanica]